MNTATLPPVMRPAIAGIFVGGQATRMGGRPKGLLVAPSGETIVARWARLFGDVGVPVVLVGHAAPYASLKLDAIDDAVVSRGALHGPIAGLLALLDHAGERAAYCVACDMPYASASLVSRLRDAAEADVVAARRGNVWEPFFSRWNAATTRSRVREFAERGERRLQSLLDALAAAPLGPLSVEEARELRDWDTPDDVTGGAARD